MTTGVGMPPTNPSGSRQGRIKGGPVIEGHIRGLPGGLDQGLGKGGFSHPLGTGKQDGRKVFERVKVGSCKYRLIMVNI